MTENARDADALTGQGRLHLPRFVGDSPEENTSDVASSPQGHGATVLLVEDERSVRATCARFLEILNYRALVAATPAEARAIAARHKGEIDVLLTDVVMQGMSGPELATELAAGEPTLRVLYMSGYTAEAVDDQGMAPQGGAFIAKPFSRDALACKLRDVLHAGTADETQGQ